MEVWRPDKGYVGDCHCYQFGCQGRTDVERVGPDTYRAYFDDVYVQRPGEPRHQAYVTDIRGWKHGCRVGHGITVRGAVDVEFKTAPRTYGCPGDVQEESFLLFRMPGE